VGNCAIFLVISGKSGLTPSYAIALAYYAFETASLH